MSSKGFDVDAFVRFRIKEDEDLFEERNVCTSRRMVWKEKDRPSIQHLFYIRAGVDGELVALRLFFVIARHFRQGTT